jgi:hypothetical protein
MPHLTPTEILIKYPELQSQLKWRKDMFSFFLKNKLLNGYYNRNKRMTMINESSLLRLIDFTKKITNH